ncbi:helix-turn-helix transcriptional regulator [Paenibacillus dauci]|uniref:helix-turn-helix transcriptional regulator n=1 Tax=Paenibacillus dauci TaxID=1567106 RepID=UPI00069662D3|nr:AraC family transcriptional regulator [Paenibacillus dauci]
MPKHYDIPLHSHSFFEICYVVSGTGFYIEDNRIFELKTGSLFISRPKQRHRISSQNGLFLLYVGFELNKDHSVEQWNMLMARAAICEPVVITLDPDSMIIRLWDSLLLQAACTAGTLSQRILHDLACALLLSMLNVFVPEEYSVHPPVPSKSAVALFSQAQRFIKDNLSLPLRLIDTAAYLHISSRHLSRIFTQQWGGSYSDYVQNERLQMAATLLKTTGHPIKTIAQMTGFSSVQYFTRVFTLKYRTAPGLFRTLYTDQTSLSFQDHNNSIR